MKSALTSTASFTASRVTACKPRSFQVGDKVVILPPKNALEAADLGTATHMPRVGNVYCVQRCTQVGGEEVIELVGIYQKYGFDRRGNRKPAQWKARFFRALNVFVGI